MEKGDQVGGAVGQHRLFHLGGDELHVGGVAALGQAPGAGQERGVRLDPDDVEPPAATGVSVGRRRERGFSNRCRPLEATMNYCRTV